MKAYFLPLAENFQNGGSYFSRIGPADSHMLTVVLVFQTLYFFSNKQSYGWVVKYVPISNKKYLICLLGFQLNVANIL